MENRNNVPPGGEEPVHETRFTTRNVTTEPDGTAEATEPNPTADPDAANGSCLVDEDGRLISRNTSTMTQQEVTTVTRVYRTYERVPNDYDLADSSSERAAPAAGSGGDYTPPSAEPAYARPNGDASQHRFSSGSEWQQSSPQSSVTRNSAAPGRQWSGRLSSSRSRPDPDGAGGIAMDAQQAAMHQQALAAEQPEFRDPDLDEVVQFLCHWNQSVRANAAAHLAHLSYMNDEVKHDARQLGAIALLVEQTSVGGGELQRNACCALRNLTFGRNNDENKVRFRMDHFRIMFFIGQDNLRFAILSRSGCLT